MAMPRKLIVDGKTKCSKCGELKSIFDFYKDRHAKNGLTSKCKNCENIATKEWQAKNKEWRKSYNKKCYDKSRDFVTAYKKDLKCQECGETHPACLVFHHRRPEEKGFNIGQCIKGKSVEQIMDEIVKCNVLCANCHRKLHYNLKRDT